MGGRERQREGVSHAGVMIVGAGERAGFGRLGRAGEIPWNGAIKWAKTDDGRGGREGRRRCSQMQRYDKSHPEDIMRTIRAFHPVGRYVL